MAETFKDEDQKNKPSRVRAAAKFLFDVPTWLGVDNITEGFTWISNIFKRVFFVRWGASNVLTETFDQAMQRQGLTDEDLKKQQKNFLRASFTFILLGILGIIYEVYLWQHGDILVFIAALLMCILFFLQSYFYSFWYFQIKVRRLGCSMKAWFNWMVRGKL